MLAKRIIVCLDVRDGRTVKGVRFAELREAGSPAEQAARYSAHGADEIVVLDVSATLQGRLASRRTIAEIAASVTVPLTVGGGVGSLSDIDALLCSGADKVAINSAAVRDPSILTEAARMFGRQCVVISIDAQRNGSGWSVFTRSGTQDVTLDAVSWAREASERGAGEVLITSIDADGTQSGFDLDLTREVSEAVDVPVIASGGARDADSFADALIDGKADAALGASVFHYGTVSFAEVKSRCAERGVLVRA
jgi:cyclase